MKKLEYRDYLEDIVRSIDEINQFTKGMDFKIFASDRKTVNAVLRSLEVIGEAAKKIPEKLRSKYLKIPWKKMAGMRDKLIHEYFGVDLVMIWKVINGELKSLRWEIKKMLKDFS
jgi:uncharacterized protein with HEPN domain